MHGIEILLVLVLVAFTQGTNSSLFPNWQSSWIIGGTDALPGEFPYMASVKVGDEFCGGAIISKLLVLTAAHCLDGIHAQSIEVVLGVTIYRRGVPRIAASGIVIHSAYNKHTKQNDIALLRLRKSLVYSTTVQPIALPKQGEKIAIGEECVITGWGFVRGSAAQPGYLQKLKVKIISRREGHMHCNPIFDNDICAMADPGKGTYGGDSGGPLVCDGKLVGILSGGGITNSESYRFSIYAGVSNYINWIKKNGPRRHSI